MRKNLLNENPELAMTWDYAKNAPLRPEHVSPMSRRSVWWICPSGHSWQAPIYRRSMGFGCPYDAGKTLGNDMKNAAKTRH
jgi:hypothetical protein